MPPPPPKNIKDLKLADISKLDIQDLQKLDYLGFLKDVAKSPDLAITLIAPILAIFIGFNMYSKSQVERKTLHFQLTQMDEKIKIIDAYQKSQTEFDKFINELPPPLTENEFVDKITDFAVQRGVQIGSFSPTKNQSDPHYSITMINLNATTNTYEDMWLFIHDIENSGFSLRINSWSGNMGPQSQSSNRRNRDTENPNDTRINFRLEIAAISFKK